MKDRNSGVERSLHPNQISQIQDCEEDQGVTEWLIGGDQGGNIAIFKDRLLGMVEQISQNAVVSVKFVNSMFRVAAATSDGSFSIFQMK